MADETEECPCSWLDLAKAASIFIASLTALLGTVGGLFIGARNGDKIDKVETIQEQHIEKSSKDRANLDAGLGPNLLASWVYLQRQADEEPDNKLARDSATNARKTYEAWLSQQRAKTQP